MSNDKELGTTWLVNDTVRPKIYIDYMHKGNGYPILNGKFGQIPEDAFGAQILIKSPVLHGDGKWYYQNFYFNIFVGESLSIDDAAHSSIDLNTYDNDNARERTKSFFRDIQYFKLKGTKKVVNTPMGVYSLEDKDAVFGSHEEMAKEIRNIYQKFISNFYSLIQQQEQNTHIHR